MATIYDLFEVTGISAHTTYSEANGNLIGVVDGANSVEWNDGEFDEGDTFVLDGVTYTIDLVQEPLSSGRFTLADGTNLSFDPASESNLSVTFLHVSNGPDVRYFIVPNDSYGDMNVTEIRTGGIEDVAGNDSAVISTFNNEVNVVCFAAGTMIGTPSGEVPVQAISVGDRVTTRDNGDQTVRHVLTRHLEFDSAPERLKPIVFERGSLGPNRPSRRLCVSPQHRMLVTQSNGGEVLVPAKALTGRRGVRVMKGKREVTYYHLVFSRHEIIRANGTLTESFFPGEVALRAIHATCRAEIREVFCIDPHDRQERSNTPAAPILRVQEARRHALDFT